MTHILSQERLLITAALPYANGTIHFGHLAGAYLPADCYARFQRLLGNEVCFICGSDEYGVAITLASELQGRSPQEHVDIYHGINQELFKKLNMSFDHYSRTTTKLHAETSQEFFTTLLKKGLITPMESEQLYCQKEDRFYADRYVTGTCPKCGFDAARGDECTRCGASYEATDLKDPKTKRGLQPLVRKKTTHWYLRLDLLKSDVMAWIEQKKSWKPNVVNFIKEYISDLKPRAITRDMTWGVPVPLKEAEGKVLYVWFDAPIGYISATKEWAEKIGSPEKWRVFWLEPSTKFVQFIGKDNIAFHAVIFPSMIMGQDLAYKMVDELPANEFYNLEGKQFSKSDGWYIDLKEFLDKFSPDLLRYTIASNAPETQDSEFTWKDFQMRVNSELVGKFGNFIHRTLVFIQNKYGSVVPDRKALSPIDHDFMSVLYEKIDLIKDAFASFRLRRACQLIMEMAQAGNVYFDAKKPWNAPDESKETTLALCYDCVRLLSLVVAPIMPVVATRIEELINLPPLEHATWYEKLTVATPSGHRIREDIQPLFQKIEDSMIEKEEEKLGATILPTVAPEVVKLSDESMISFDDFGKITLEVVQIVAAEAVPKSKKLLKLEVLAKDGKRQIISGIAQRYKPEELIGKKVVACTNLKPAKLMGLESHGMILAASSPDDQRLHIVEVPASEPGDSVH